MRSSCKWLGSCTVSVQVTHSHLEQRDLDSILNPSLTASETLRRLLNKGEHQLFPSTIQGQRPPHKAACRIHWNNKTHAKPRYWVCSTAPLSNSHLTPAHGSSSVSWLEWGSGVPCSIGVFNQQQPGCTLSGRQSAFPNLTATKWKTMGSRSLSKWASTLSFLSCRLSVSDNTRKRRKAIRLALNTQVHSSRVFIHEMWGQSSALLAVFTHRSSILKKPNSLVWVGLFITWMEIKLTAATKGEPMGQHSVGADRTATRVFPCTSASVCCYSNAALMQNQPGK